MEERAILPLNTPRVTAGYKNKAYRAAMGFSHFGVDFADKDRKDFAVYAPFEMKITHAGYDTLMGNTVIAVSTNDVLIHSGVNKGKHRKLVVRFAHLASIAVKVGEIVKPEGGSIARYGSTGKYGGSPHLHVEIDTDPNFPNYSPTLSGNSNIWKAGTDSTLHPMYVFHVDEEGSRGAKQTLYYEMDSGNWVETADKQSRTYGSTAIRAKGV